MRRWVVGHARILSSLLVVVVAAAALGLYWFQPWKLFTDETVHDALPAVAVTAAAAPSAAAVPSSGPSDATSIVPPAERLLSTGTFVSHEHATHGRVSIVQRADGTRVLAVANLDTSNGPDLRVWLSNAPVLTTEASWYTFDDDQYQHVSLGALKGNLGDQVYDIPAAADLTKLVTVTIWCDRFNVSFGAAALSLV